ncbi:hypothetical protein [Streptomyces sp. NPDC004726]
MAPDRPGLYRLVHPEQDGLRRARQAVHDLRAHGFTVQADYTLDPAPDPEPGLPDRLATARQTRLARAAAARSPQLNTTVSRQPAAASVPAAAPTTVRQAGRSR